MMSGALRSTEVFIIPFQDQIKSRLGRENMKATVTLKGCFQMTVKSLCM